MRDELYLEEVARLYGLTVDSVRGHLRRGSDAIPRPFRKRGRRWVWRRADVEADLGGEPPPRRGPKRRPV